MVKDSGTPPPPPPSSDEESIMPRPSSAGGEESGGDLRPPLPVMALREKIVAKIQENRVTLIVGDTGCGKSSQVPQFLLEENVEPILCTQPRRFAVVAIARMVAKARNCDIGGDVGYHIGHSNVSNIGSRSRIVFKTAGVVLEQIRDKGLDALKYKVIILDEVHERSVESDLLLTCVKQFMMKKNDLRLVLMSATADITRYRDYFKDLGRGERVEVIAIPSAPRHVIFERKVLYLDQVADLLGMDTESLSNRYCPYSDADMRPETHSLIFKLVLHLHENEPNIEKSILVFLPTYCSLEQLWILLKPHSRFFKVHILHSSIDIDQALLAMSVCNSHRKVILATNIAESSVTIPGVAYVVDSCRSLQVFWDCNRKVDSSELVWVSKSQADQRRGRTGRTCDGKIYRLVTRSFYTSLDDYEYPAILRLSLRQQVLMICCSESKAINDPKVLLQRVLDPPDPERVEDALGFLVQIKALKKSPYRGRYEVTFYGRLLDSLPLSFDASVLTLKLGEIGLLHEGIVIGILMDVQPLPILQPFGHQILFQQFVDNYFRSFNSSAFLMGKKEIIFMGNLCAFQFWQRIFKDKIRLEWLKQVANGDEPKVPQTIVTKLEEEWCFSHNLLQTSLHNVSEIYEDIMEIIHCFRPSFMEKVDFPCYLEPYTFDHECLFRSELETNSDALLLEEENIDSASLRRTCLSVPYVLSDDFQVNSVAESLKALIKEIRVQYSQKTSIDHGAAMNYATLLLQESPICRFFANGSCNKGDQCTFSHSLQAKKPTCKFFFTLQGCRNGDACLFSHNNEPHLASFAVSSHSLKEDANPIAYNFLQLLPASADSCVVVMDEKNLIFSTKLSQHYDPSKIIATTPRTCSQSGSSSTGFTIIWNVAHPCHKINEDNYFLPWRQVKCILWFADIEVNDFSGDHPFLQNLFESLAIRMFAESLYDVKVILAMNNIKFSQLQVERLARESFFYLTKSFPFDESTFGKIERMNGSPRPKQSNAPILYVFSMVPPTGIQFGDYSSVFRRALYHHHAQRFLFHSKTISSAGRMLAGVSVMTN